MRMQLKSVSTNTGFLKDAKVEFAPGLTCIIGARGTCKSTLVETIRFVFDHDPSRIEGLTASPEQGAEESKRGLIAATLGAGTATCSVVGPDPADAQFVVEREVGVDPRIFVGGVREHTDTSVLRGIEIFSQGDLQRIADDSSNAMRLRLIDRPNRQRVDLLQEKRRRDAGRLTEVGQKLRVVHVEMATLGREVAQLVGFRSQLDQSRSTAPAATPELDAERKAHEQRQRVLADLRRLEADRARVAAEVMAALSPAQEMGEIVERLRNSESEGMRDVVAVATSITKTVSGLGAAAAALGARSIAADIHELAQRFENDSQRYYDLRQEQQTVNESIKVQVALQKQIDHLGERARQLESLVSDESRLLDERRQLRITLAKIDDEVFDLRTVEIDAINRLHGETIHLSLASSAATREYAERLSSCLSGSRIRSQEEVARAIAERFRPSALIDIVEATNTAQLATMLDRDLAQMTRVVSHLSDHPDLYSLEAEPPVANLQITMYQDGEPKAVESLSRGQKATALLPIILRDLPYPLIFDQPEDDLDNKFIFAWLIKIVRELKLKRQIIFVTHNANIPVLGSADRVLVMHMDSPTQAGMPLAGTVDERKKEILDLLEGGAAAFAAREEQYHDLLTSRE